MFNMILAKLDGVAAVPGKKDKAALLAVHMADPDFKQVVVLMLNPFKTMGILNYELPIEPPTHPLENLTAYDFFDSLVSRICTGGAARKFAGSLVAQGFPSELMLRILTKDPKAGFGEAIVNDVCPGLIPEFPYMRCSLPAKAKFDKWDWKTGVISQEKADGMYCTIDKHPNGQVVLRSRQGSEFDATKFPKIIHMAEGMLTRGTQTQGELLVMRGDKILAREIGNGILNSILKGGDFEEGDRPIYKAWDQIPLDIVKPGCKYTVEYSERLSGLSKQLEGILFPTLSLIDTRIVHSLIAARAHCKELMLLDKEGTIISEPHAPWFDGTSLFKVKLKLEADCDLKIVGFRPGKGKNAATFGSIICRTSDDLLEVAVSGFSDKERIRVWAIRDSLLDTIMTVTSNLLMVPAMAEDYHSLFLPRHKEFRLDKKVADTLQQVKDSFEAAINAV